MRQPTGRQFLPSRLAAEKIQKLFRQLESFVNLGGYPGRDAEDNLSAFHAFGRNFPDFFPFEITDQRGNDLRWTLHSYPFFFTQRDILRDLWRGGRNEGWLGSRLSILLGLRSSAEWIRYKNFQPQSSKIKGKVSESHVAHGPVFMSEAESTREDVDLDLLMSVYELHVRKQLKGKHPTVIRIRCAQMLPDWRSGDFNYYPNSDFQKAVYVLFRQSWRAKVCNGCGNYYIADKPPQLYCSLKCSNQATRDRNRGWWRLHGDAWRRDRAKKSKQKGKK